ncbi:MAG: hypothetical protein WA220_02450 [Candidatus Nitrosopolaris sp.]
MKLLSTKEDVIIYFIASSKFASLRTTIPILFVNSGRRNADLGNDPSS